MGYQQLAEDGFAVLGERLRIPEERAVVAEVLQKVLGAKVGACLFSPMPCCCSPAAAVVGDGILGCSRCNAGLAVVTRFRCQLPVGSYCLSALPACLPALPACLPACRWI